MGSRLTRLTVCGLAAAGLFALAAEAPALAQPQGAKPAGAQLSDKQRKDKAKKAFKDAEAKFDKKDYAGALVAYQQADDLFPGPRPKYKIAVCLDKLGNAATAAGAYQVFLSASPDPDKLKDAIADSNARLDILRKTPARIHFVTDPAGLPGAKLTLDGAVQTVPDLTVPPGHHTFAATATGYEGTAQDVDVKFGEQRDVTIAMRKGAAPVVVAVVVPPPVAPGPLVPAQKPQPPPQAPRSNVPAYVTIGLAGAGAVVGTIFGVAALGAKSDFKKTPTTDNADKTDRDALIADMSYAVALTFGVTGAVLLLSDDAKVDPKAGAAPAPSKPSTALHLLPYVGPTGGGASATLKF